MELFDGPLMLTTGGMLAPVVEFVDLPKMHCRSQFREDLCKEGWPVRLRQERLRRPTTPGSS